MILGVLASGAAAAAPAAGAKAAKPAPIAVWRGVFDPGLPAHAPWDKTALTPVAHGGTVRVLAPAEGTAADGEVVIVHPILGKTATGVVAHGAVALAAFAFDQRDGDDGVLVLPAGTAVHLVAPGAGDAAAIKGVLLRTDALAGVRRALTGLELAGVDVDGDGRAELVTTYGCAAWFDGSCQARGQFVLARRGERWIVVE
jgi:hypothetical protein